MTSLLDTLRYFVLWYTGGEVVIPQLQFEWPVEVRQFGQYFEGYTWALSFGSSAPRVFGICALGCRPPSQLADIEGVILKPVALDRPTGRRGDDIEYYLIIELFDPKFARADLAMLIQGNEWYLLDEHVLRRPIGPASTVTQM